MNSSIPTRNAPTADELELTVFGPGVGECLVLHLGNGEWIVVDSCVLPGTSKPAALSYLRSIGVDPAASIRSVVATHWHDDHIQGLAAILEECPRAEFVMSAALATEQFFELVLEAHEQNRMVAASSSAREFAEILAILESRHDGNCLAGPHRYAQDGTRLFCGGFDGSVEVWALSPSAPAITNSQGALASRLLEPGSVRRFANLAPNDLSIALLIKTPAFHLLLGADLENTSAPQFGWKAVLASNVRPVAQSGAFKVPHHGSANADHPGVWTSMCASDPIAIVTPYTKLKNPLPTSGDCARIRARTNQAFCTATPRVSRPTRRQGVDGIVNRYVKSRHRVDVGSGHVRLRVDLNAMPVRPQVELFETAVQL